MSAPFETVDGLRIVQHNPEQWARVREKFQIPSNILDGFRFDTLHPSGGKGGDLLKFHGSYYIVKQVTGSDQDTLLKVTDSLVDHVTTTDSLIARFFLHFELPEDPNDKYEGHYGGKSYCVMNNWLPQFVEKKVGEAAKPVTVYNQMYDLKGSADDKTLVRREKKIPEVHKRFYNVNMWSQCCWSRERHEYYENKHHAYNVRFHVTAAQQAEIQRRITSDVDWLTGHGLMDYSLVVGVAEQKPERMFPRGSDEMQPYTARKRDSKGTVHTMAYYMGIIDFLQEWTPTKISAYMIKKMVAPQPQSTVPPRQYGEQFRNFFEHKWVGDADPDEEQAIVATKSKAVGYQTPRVGFDPAAVDDPMKGLGAVRLAPSAGAARP